MSRMHDQWFVARQFNRGSPPMSGEQLFWFLALYEIALNRKPAVDESADAEAVIRMYGFPSLGSWVSYALGSENHNLPAYVAMPDPRGVPQNGSNNWGPGFLPAAFQGTPMSSKEPIRHLTPPGVSVASDLAARSLLQRVNERHLQQHPGDGKLAARIASYELAARMQLSVP